MILIFFTCFFFFFNDTATTEIYTLSLHDALPISRQRHHSVFGALPDPRGPRDRDLRRGVERGNRPGAGLPAGQGRVGLHAAGQEPGRRGGVHAGAAEHGPVVRAGAHDRAAVRPRYESADRLPLSPGPARPLSVQHVSGPVGLQPGAGQGGGAVGRGTRPAEWVRHLGHEGIQAPVGLQIGSPDACRGTGMPCTYVRLRPYLPAILSHSPGRITLPMVIPFALSSAVSPTPYSRAIELTVSPATTRCRPAALPPPRT